MQELKAKYEILWAKKRYIMQNRQDILKSIVSLNRVLDSMNQEDDQIGLKIKEIEMQCPNTDTSAPT